MVLYCYCSCCCELVMWHDGMTVVCVVFCSEIEPVHGLNE